MGEGGGGEGEDAVEQQLSVVARVRVEEGRVLRHHLRTQRRRVEGAQVPEVERQQRVVLGHSGGEHRRQPEERKGEAAQEQREEKEGSERSKTEHRGQELSVLHGGDVDGCTDSDALLAAVVDAADMGEADERKVRDEEVEETTTVDCDHAALPMKSGQWRSEEME